MDHNEFMTTYLKFTLMIMHREETDELAPKILKFLASYIASRGEETDGDGGSHPVVTSTFERILGVSLSYAMHRCRN